ncbi:MAG: cupin fold metalloprotein, WbuC family [Acidobacteria bacterium]|nr:cupin fold metalloprotein, WbuC family [Acidobacteriota bacterium]
MKIEPQLITTALFERIAGQAEQSPRRRMNHNFHASAEESPHRMLNVLLRGTYVRPHRHVTPPKTEAFLPLTGSVGIVVFNDDGGVTGVYRLDAEGPVRGIDLPAGIWHTVLALTEQSVCYEVKPGPWVPASDKDFAAWAPSEGTPEAAGIVGAWEKLFL